jgi:hypothetical protein
MTQDTKHPTVLNFAVFLFTGFQQAKNTDFQVRNAELLSPILFIILLTRRFILVLTRNKDLNVAHTMYTKVKFVYTKLLEYILG